MSAINANNAKFIEQLKVDGWSVKTDTGYKKIALSNKTKKFKVYELITESHSLKCADFHLVYDENYNPIKIIDLKKGDKIITENGIEKVIEIKETDKFENMYDLSILDENHRYFTNGILSHNTTISAFYVLYEACFPKSRGDILLVAHKQAHSMEILKRIKDMYYSMPMWLKPGLVKNNETSVVFDNGMRIIAEATTANAARGKSLKIVYCVDGKSKIKLRNKKTGEIREVEIQEIYNNNFYK